MIISEPGKSYSLLHFGTGYRAKRPVFTKSYGYGNCCIMPKELLDKYVLLSEKFKDNTLKPNSSVYLTQLALLPKYKLENHIAETKSNVKITRKPSDIDAFIINDFVIKKAYFNSYKPDENVDHYIVPYSEFIEEFASHMSPEDEYSYPGNYTHGKLKPNFFIIPQTIVSGYPQIEAMLSKHPIERGIFKSQGDTGAKAFTQIELFQRIITLVEQGTHEIIFDRHINHAANVDTIIDLDVFKTLYDMLSSHSKDNEMLAQEIIANCNYKESEGYILFLLNLFPILRNKSQNTNYQNIWSQFVKFSSIYSYDSYELFIKALLNKHPEYTKLICDCLPTHLNKTYGINLIKSINYENI